MRGKIDASEYKDYILGLIFYKFLSDNEVRVLRADGWTDADLPDLVEDYNNDEMREEIRYLQDKIGYFIEYKNLFSTWMSGESKFSVADLSGALNSFDRLVDPGYRSVYSGIFTSLQAGLSKLGSDASTQTRVLKSLMRVIRDIPTDGRQDYDVLGYVYEFLISNFAASAGKKAGEFYTPHEVASLMSEIVAEHHKDKREIEIYDPTSGSGSLLITIGKSISRHTANPDCVRYYAQELKENTYNLTRMNLVMRGIAPSNINTRCADSLDEDWPIYKEGSEIGQPLYVDAVVSNPPYSQTWDNTDRASDPRFKDYGVAPTTKADYAFLLHELHHLKPDGVMTIVLPHGVLFRGSSEYQIRMNLIEKNNVDTVIGLPANIFFGTGISTLILVLKQHRTDDDVLFIDASRGFVKAGKQNKLRERDIRQIADTVRDRAVIDGYSRRVSREEIRLNDYNLNLPRYVDGSTPAEQYDIHATVYGGIPQQEIDGLQAWWDALPSLRGELFAAEPGAAYAALRTDDTRAVIEANADTHALRERFDTAFADFADNLHRLLIDDPAAVNPLLDHDRIADDIFRRLEGIPLVDRYAAYQVLADCWGQIDGDIEIIRQEGIDAVRREETDYKTVKKDGQEIEVPCGLKGRIIPFAMVQQEKLAAELQALTAAEARLEAIAAEVAEEIETFNEAEAAKYLDAEKDNAPMKKEIQRDARPKAVVDPETKEKLARIAELWEEETALNKQIKAHGSTLEAKTVEVLHNLTEAEVSYFLHRKWIDPIVEGIRATLTERTAALEKAVKHLAEKYAVSLVDIDRETAEAQSKLQELIDELDGDRLTIDGLNKVFKL